MGGNAFCSGNPRTGTDFLASRRTAGSRYILFRRGGGGTHIFPAGTHARTPFLSLSLARSRTVCGWQGHEKGTSHVSVCTCESTGAQPCQTQTGRERASRQRQKCYGVSYNMDFTTFAVNHQKTCERGGKKAGEGLDFI